MDFFGGEKIWRFLTYFWTIIYLPFIVFHFFSQNSLEFLVTPFSVLYVGILGLYVSTKEFDRWYAIHKGQHPGEIFVMIWTIVMLGLFLGATIFSQKYKIDNEIVAVYIAVLSIFAITQKSKRLYEKKGRSR